MIIKKGDWLISKAYKYPIYVDDEIIKIHERNPSYHQFKEWIPISGELCWFWNIENNSIVYILGEFKEIYSNCYVNKRDKVNTKLKLWENIEPFTGEKPKFFN